MNDLSLFNSNQSKETFEAGSKVKNTTSEEVVTTKQLADILGVDVRTVQMTAKRILDPTKVLSRVINGGKSMIFDEKQATFIKQEIQKHHNLASRQIDTVSTEFEENQVIANAMAILQRRNVELQKRVKEAERQLTEQAPKVATYNRIANATGLKSIQEVAKILHIGSKTLFAILRDKKIFYREKSNGVNIPVEKYIKQGLFEVKEEPYRKDGKDCVYTRIFATAKGLLWLEKIIQDLEVSND
jgi:phage antirepressor YoqD-like protein